MSEFSHLKNKLLAEQVEDEIYHYILDTCPALALPGLALAAAVPTAWAAWALLAEPPDGLPPEQLLEQVPGFDFATLCDFERPAAVP